MKETTKTSIFLALAVLLAILAVVTRPVAHEMSSQDMINKPLFPKFNDPLGIKSLEITKVGSLGQQLSFKIAETAGVWTIPTHEYYPADAKDRMPQVAEALTDLTVIEVANDLVNSKDVEADQAMYGVLDPLSDKGGPSDGMGTRVKVTGPNDEVWVDMIIGKEVESPNSPDTPNDAPKRLRYVRVADEQAVYVVAIELDRFSTRFEDWIEKNLLDISTFDIKQVFIDEYSLDAASHQPTFLGDITLDYSADTTGGDKWKLQKLMSFRGDNFEYFQQNIPAGEELNAELLDAMVFALNDLKIVDVVRKPEKLRDAIRERASLEKLALDTSLASSGFNIVQMPDIKADKSKMKVELLSANGDFKITLKNGVVYVMRFGDAASMSTGDDGDGKTNEENIGMNRYLFIMSEFDEDSIPKPEPQKPTELPADTDFAKMNEELEKQNKRAQDEYEATIKEGRDRAAKLNERFSSWYYVISEEVYKKIHLDRKSIFKPVKAEEKSKDNPLADPLAIPEIPEIQQPPKEEEQKPVEQPVEDPKPTEQPVEEPKPAEEPKPTEQPVEEPKPTEQPVEEPKPTEQLVEEPKPAEQPVEVS